tara:strand:- start:5767 stop:7539 length:1773 start_codon:yes stop_codon:yes gene_type:complete
MTQPNTNLGSLDFNSVKGSIIDFLRTQDTLKDFDYSGSAVQVLIDVLAYNTMYYAHYSNMVAGEMFLDSAQRLSSLISLVKPLGYVIPGKISAKARAKVRHGGDDNIIEKYTRFSGRNEAGTAYSFYTLDEYSLNLDGEAIVEIYEGKSLTKNIPLLVDRNTQKGFLHGLDIDISTITVEVKLEGKENWDPWAKADNIQSGLNDTSSVYWLERSELGFFIVFGGNVGINTTVQVGKQIGPNDLVRVSYLKTNGRSGNEVGNFKVQGFAGAETDTVSMSSGGSDEPNLESIRFFAPRWFAAQDRAVTVEDCRAMLVRHGYGSDVDDALSVFNVWGGEEMDPPMYGRVFVSVNENNELELSAIAESIIRLLKEKTCVTILPEFVNPQQIEVIVSGMLGWDPMRTVLSGEQIMNKIMNTITKKYPLKFNNTFSASEISGAINSVGDSAVSTDSSTFSFSIKGVVLGPQYGPVRINFGNKLKQSSVSSSEFVAGTKIVADYDIPDGQLIKIRTYGGVDKFGKQKIEAFYQNENNTISRVPNVGVLTPERGILDLHEGTASEPFHVIVAPSDSVVVADKNIISKVNVSNLQLVRV